MKLLTQAILKKLPPLYGQQGAGEEDVAHVKFFTPWTNWTWNGTEYDPVERLFFGLVVGQETELGYFSLTELEQVRGPWGLRIERDLHWTPRTVRAIRAGHD